MGIKNIITDFKVALTLGLFLSIGIVLYCFVTCTASRDEMMLSHIVDTKSQDLQFYWQDDSAKTFKSILALKTWLDIKHKNLVFAMNGGMYKQDNSPLGLFIKEYSTLTPIDSSIGYGNFYLKPNGVFYISSDNQAVICKTTDFSINNDIKFALQSGPMLVVDGKIHNAFNEGSSNVTIRNGVGILPDKKVIFAMTKVPINFYDFAKYFKDLGCVNALYLDGFVSRTYLPEKNWIQTDGNFGVIIGVTSH